MNPIRAAIPALLAAACVTRQPAPSPSAMLTAPSSPPPASCCDYADDAPTARTAFESRALAEVLRALQGTGATLRPSAALDRAAAAIAASAAGGESDPLAREHVQEALRVAAAFDPSPRVHLAIGPPDDALSALLARLGGDGATHFGLSDRVEGGVHHLALLLSRRRARIDRFPSATRIGAEVELSGELIGLHHPRLYVTYPDGSSAEIVVEGGRSFTSRFRLERAGRYAVEIVGTGGAGPEVAALLSVTAGTAPLDPGRASRPAPAVEPPDVEAAEAAVVEAVNRLRGARGRSPLARAADLGEIARRHSERMLAAGAVAHVLPGSPELAERLIEARVRYRRALENVARGESTLAAHAATEESPAHRSNLLAPEATRVGVGIARGALPTGEPIVYLTEIFVEPASTEEPDRLTPDARVREVLWKERERRGLPSLTNDLALEGLARDAAARMRAEDSGAPDGLTEAALRLGRGLAAADGFIASGAAEALRSRNLTDARFRRVGVGVVQGDSRRYGPGRLFVAVLYSN